MLDDDVGLKKRVKITQEAQNIDDTSDSTDSDSDTGTQDISIPMTRARRRTVFRMMNASSMAVPRLPHSICTLFHN